MNDPKPDYFDAFLMSLAFGTIITIAFVMSQTTLKETQKQLANANARNQILADKLTHNYSNCAAMLKDKSTRKIMCAQYKGK